MNLNQFFPEIEPGCDPKHTQPLNDETIKRVADLLRQQGYFTYSLKPRTYTLLYLIGKVNQIKYFEANSDDYFPYMDWTLPRLFKDAAANCDFLRYQHLVFPGHDHVHQHHVRPHMQLREESECNLVDSILLGHGYYGAVDRVRGKFSTKEYARKRVFKAKSAIQQARLESFERELGTLKRLRHHHLVQHVGSYTDPKWVAFMMLPIADCDLATWMGCKPDKQNIREAFGCLASAVSYLHQESVRHKDIKPQNILVHQGKVLLTDFGSALDWKDMDASTTAGTAEATFTRKYAAPEVLGGDKRNSSSDVFSLGCVFLELATSLFGHCVDELHQHCLSTGTKTIIFAENSIAVVSWIRKLRAPEITKTDSKILDITLKMLDLKGNNRPSASEITATFGGLGTSYLCEACNTDRLISDLERKNVYVRDPKQRGPELCKAAIRGNVAIFQSLVKITDDTDYRITSNGAKATALDLAMENGHIDIVKSFLTHSLAKGLDVDMRRALFLALERNDTRGIEELRYFGADTNAEDEHGTSLLYTAISQRRYPVVKLLISSGAKLDHGEISTKRTVIHGAVRAGDADMLRFLLNQHQIDVNSTDIFGMTALHEAVFNGDRRLTNPLLKLHADPNVCNGKGDTPLISAVRNHHHLVKPLISAGANASLCDAHGAPPSCIAASMGVTAVLEELLGADCSISHVNAKGENPLHLAVDVKNEGIVDMLLRKRPSYMAEEEKERGMTPLHYAAYDGSTAILRKLLDRNLALAHQKDLLGRTPLLCAINEGGMVSTVQLLLDRVPTTIDIPCAEGNTPLMMACEHGLVGISRLLLERGANVDAKNSVNRTALHIAVSKEGSDETVKLLLSKGANANLPAADGSTALGAASAAQRGSMMALLKWEGNADIDYCHEGRSTQLMRAIAQGGSLEEAGLLLKIGADVDARNDRRRTALFVAVETGRLDAVELLLGRACDVDAVDADRITPLMLAASLGHADIVRALIDAGASLEARANNGNTVLSKAADRGRADVVKLLVDAGADIEVVGRKDGLTPLFRAACRGHRRTAGVLVRAGADLASAKLLAKRSKVVGAGKARKLLKELEAYRPEKTVHRNGGGSS